MKQYVWVHQLLQCQWYLHKVSSSQVTFIALDVLWFHIKVFAYWIVSTISSFHEKISKFCLKCQCPVFMTTNGPSFNNYLIYRIITFKKSLFKYHCVPIRLSFLNNKICYCSFWLPYFFCIFLSIFISLDNWIIFCVCLLSAIIPFACVLWCSCVLVCVLVIGASTS